MTTCHCKRCGYDWSSRVEQPKNCPACKSPYWDRERGVLRGRPGQNRSGEAVQKNIPEPDVENVTSGYPASALEAAAKSEAPIGRSVTEFLMKNGPVAGVSAPAARNYWGPEIDRIARSIQNHPGDGWEEFDRVMNARNISVPGAYASWEVAPKVRARLVAWLNQDHPIPEAER